MTAIDELKGLIDLEGIVRRVTSRFDDDMKKISVTGNRNYLREHTFRLVGSDKFIELLSGTGLIEYERNHFGMGNYWYTPKAKELYEKLKAEGFYDKK